MEYVERGSLRPYVGQMTLAQISGVLEGLLAGLTNAEQNGIVHRDLKPENLMVTSDGRVKIADFGIAKATTKMQTGAFLTATGTTVGTPTYMAPEQAMAQDIGPWTDLYSVGCMAFEMFTGKVPFHDSDAPMAILLRHVNEPIAPVKSIDPHDRPGLSDWIETLLVKDPEHARSPPPRPGTTSRRSSSGCSARAGAARRGWSTAPETVERPEAADAGAVRGRERRRPSAPTSSRASRGGAGRRHRRRARATPGPYTPPPQDLPPGPMQAPAPEEPPAAPAAGAAAEPGAARRRAAPPRPPAPEAAAPPAPRPTAPARAAVRRADRLGFVTFGGTAPRLLPTRSPAAAAPRRRPTRSCRRRRRSPRRRRAPRRPPPAPRRRRPRRRPSAEPPAPSRRSPRRRAARRREAPLDPAFETFVPPCPVAAARGGATDGRARGLRHPEPEPEPAPVPEPPPPEPVAAAPPPPPPPGRRPRRRSPTPARRAAHAVRPPPEDAGAATIMPEALRRQARRAAPATEPAKPKRERKPKAPRGRAKPKRPPEAAEASRSRPRQAAARAASRLASPARRAARRSRSRSAVGAVLASCSAS